MRDCVTKGLAVQIPSPAIVSLGKTLGHKIAPNGVGIPHWWVTRWKRGLYTAVWGASKVLFNGFTISPYMAVGVWQPSTLLNIWFHGTHTRMETGQKSNTSAVVYPGGVADRLFEVQRYLRSCSLFVRRQHCRHQGLCFLQTHRKDTHCQQGGEAQSARWKTLHHLGNSVVGWKTEAKCLYEIVRIAFTLHLHCKIIIKIINLYWLSIKTVARIKRVRSQSIQKSICLPKIQH